MRMPSKKKKKSMRISVKLMWDNCQLNFVAVSIELKWNGCEAVMGYDTSQLQAEEKGWNSLVTSVTLGVVPALIPNDQFCCSLKTLCTRIFSP